MNTETNTIEDKKPARKRGRPLLYLTLESKLEAKRKYNAAYQSCEDYKERRKKKYRSDKKYRLACISRVKASVDATKDASAITYLAEVNQRINQLKESLEPVIVKHRFNKRAIAKKLKVCNLTQFAGLVLREPLLIRNWLATGKLPPPQYSDSPNSLLYSLEQAVAMARIIATNLKSERAHFLESNKNTIKLLAKTKTLR